MENSRFRLAVVGSRNFQNPMLLDYWLQKFPSITEIVSGGIQGADQLGEDWARSRKIPITIFYPDWSLGKKAGPLRNRKIVEYADAVLAFCDSQSPETTSTLNLAKAAGKPFWIVHF